MYIKPQETYYTHKNKTILLVLPKKLRSFGSKPFKKVVDTEFCVSKS